VGLVSSRFPHQFLSRKLGGQSSKPTYHQIPRQLTTMKRRDFGTHDFGAVFVPQLKFASSPAFKASPLAMKRKD